MTQGKEEFTHNIYLLVYFGLCMLLWAATAVMAAVRAFKPARNGWEIDESAEDNFDRLRHEALETASTNGYLRPEGMRSEAAMLE